MSIQRPLLIIFLMLGECTVQGQSKSLELGIEGGPSLTSIRGNILTDELESIISYSIGPTVQFNFSERFALRTGCSLERNGSAGYLMAVDVNGNVIGKTKLHEDFDYMTFPLLARVSFGTKVKFVVNAGPFLGYLLKQTEHSDPILDFPGYSVEHTDRYRRTDLGVTAGVGVVIRVRTHLRVSAELRNNLGLMNVSASPLINNGSFKTNSTVLLVGCGYVFGKQ